jgi:hypothetical protein
VVWDGVGRVDCGDGSGSALDFVGNSSDPIIRKRQNLPPACTLNPTASNPANDVGPTLTFNPGQPSPICKSGCGTLCASDSVFCATPGLSPNNPDFWDPLDPKSPQNPNNPSHTNPTSTLPSTSAPPTSTTPPLTTTLPPGGTPSPTPKAGDGSALRYDFFTTIEDTGGDPLNELWGYGSSTKTSYKICDVSPDWSKTTIGTDMPTSVKDFQIQGSNCAYTETSSWSNAKVGDRVGNLTCDKFATATCFKESVKGNCISQVMAVTNCKW